MYSDQQEENSFILHDISKVKPAKTLAFEFKGRQVTMENNKIHYQTRFIDSNNDVIAQCERIGIPRLSINIKVFKPELDIYQIAILGLIQYFWDMMI